MRRILFLFLIVCLSPASLIMAYSKQISFGPELYYLQRTREGGTEQTGTLYGFRALFDSIERYKIYYGLEGAVSSGCLKGRTGSDVRLKSDFTQGNIEGKIGYTFQSKCRRFVSITPYALMGYFFEYNNYIKPSPMHIHFSNKFFYGGAGCVMKGRLSSCFDFALNVAVRMGFTGKMNTSHDPEMDSVSLTYIQKLQCRVSLPLTYHYNALKLCHCLTLSPFFEYRHYGKNRGIPFDFLDTKIRSWGSDLMYTLVF